MLQYVDGFTCTITENLDAISISFIQREPFVVLNENQEEIIQNQINEISSIVMTRNCAQGLLNVLSGLIASSDA